MGANDANDWIGLFLVLSPIAVCAVFLVVGLWQLKTGQIDKEARGFALWMIVLFGIVTWIGVTILVEVFSCGAASGNGRKAPGR